MNLTLNIEDTEIPVSFHELVEDALKNQWIAYTQITKNGLVETFKYGEGDLLSVGEHISMLEKSISDNNLLLLTFGFWNSQEYTGFHMLYPILRELKLDINKLLNLSRKNGMLIFRII